MHQKTIVTLVISLLFSASGFSQGGVSFQQVKEHYLHGDTRVIGNTILSEHPTRVYSREKGLNDRTDMVYVDVDNDGETYSSSSADLTVPKGAKIVYAGLYWAATYPGAEGKQKERSKRIVYDLKKKRDRPFDLVLLKTPGSTKYTQVQGELVYDGMLDGNIDLKNAAPYVCYSDVTDVLTANSKVSGTYTLANVTALEGIIYGGSSAGWMLYVIYELESEPLQYITSYQGFRFIGLDKPQDLVFNNFRAKESGEVKTSITLGALEGDLILAKDVVSIYSDVQKEFIPLKSKVRYANNFFNSSITLGEKKYLNRNPASTNTLGFDLAKINIPNPDNTVIANDATRVKLQFKTEEDRLFVFFTAFQTEISANYYQRVVVERKPDTLISIKNHQVVVEAKEVFDKDGEPLISKAKPEQEVKTQPKVIKEREAALLEMLDTPSVKVPGKTAGYYVVNHVFASAANANAWAKKMTRLGFAPQDFVRPSNGYHYIYIDFSQDPDQLYTRLQGYRKMEDLKNAWIIKVNLD